MAVYACDRLRVLSLTVPTLLAAATAQSSLRCFGAIIFDTDARAQPAVRAYADDLNSYTMRADGRMFFSGRNMSFRVDQVQIPPGLQIVDVSFTAAGGAAVLSDGSIVSWGSWHSQPPILPTLDPAPALPPGTQYLKVARAVQHALALRSDGALVCWGGANFYGELNVPPIPPGKSPIHIRAGVRSSYAILDNGVLLAWGQNSFGQTNIPALPAGVGWLDIRQGYDHMVALRTDGQVEAWGTNTHGQCNVPALPAGTTYTAIAAGLEFSAAARSDGAIVCWGRNDYGQCNPPMLPPGEFVLELSSGRVHTVALFTNGQVLDWGGDEYWGMTGVPTIGELSLPGQPPAKFRQFSRGLICTVGVLDDRRFFGFGDNSHGIITLPSQLQGIPLVKAVNQYIHTAVLTTSGQIHCWGDNTLGYTNVPPLPAGVTWTDVTLSSHHTVGLRSDGQAVGWGSNNWSELMIPAVTAPLRYTKIDADFGTTLLLRSDGAVVHVGRYINPTQLATYLIHLPPPGLAYTGIATTEHWFCVLRSDGQVDTIGTPSGSIPPVHWLYRPTPVLPPGLYYVEISGGDGHVALRRSDGQMFTTGYCDRFQDYIHPLEPNTSYVEAVGSYDMVAGRVGPTSTYVGFAQGCAGTRPASRLVPADTPAIGKTLDVTLFDLPLDIAMIAMGWSRFTSPIALAPLGLPGCDWHVALDGVALLSGQGYQARFSLPIPDQQSLIGIHFFHQALVLDPAANPFGAVVSDAAEGVVGDH